MRYLPALALLLLFLPCTCALAQSDTLVPVDTVADSLRRTTDVLTATFWRETSPGARQDYVLRLTGEGNFEEDAGPAHDRSSRYLMGRWRLDSTATTLTLGVDYFMGKRMVHPRYRRGQDFHLAYVLLAVTDEELVLRDALTGDLRHFVPTAVENYEEAARRRIPKPNFGELKLPGQN